MTQGLMLLKECEEVLRRLMATHPCLQPGHKSYEKFENKEAMTVVTDLIDLIKVYGDQMEKEHKENGWGKL